MRAIAVQVLDKDVAAIGFERDAVWNIKGQSGNALLAEAS